MFMRGRDVTLSLAPFAIPVSLENCVLYKNQQRPLSNDSDWKKEFDLD